MPVDHFGEAVARTYDQDESEMFAAATLDATVDMLADLAGGRPALELAVGTGRVALPLSERGVRVHGIDLSPAMIDRLRAKPGGERIDVTVGDIARAPAPGSFGLVYLVFNTIDNLTTQDEQVACFRNAAAHLGAGGVFVVEVGVPQLQRLPPGETVHPFAVTTTHLGFDEYDVTDQGLVSHHYTLRDGTFEQASVPFRYVWPSELDLMARLAGMRLRSRSSDWLGTPFTGTSTSHVSVWEKVSDDAW